MLYDDFIEFRTGLVHRNGYPHDKATIGVKNRMAQAQVFVLDSDALAMAAGVSLSKPSSTLEALPWIRLPFETTWVEFSNRELREIMAGLGSPNKRVEAGVVEIVRTGFLVRLEEDRLIVEYVHEDKTDAGAKIADLAPVIMTYKLSGDMDMGEIPDIDRNSPLGPGARGRVQRHLKTITEDPKEVLAERLLDKRCDWAPHPDMAGVRQSLVDMTGEVNTTSVEENQGLEMRRLVNLVLIPLLILMSCPNAVTTETVSNEKLNKQRRKKGKPELTDYRLVKMSLSKSRKRVVEGAATAAGSRTISGSLVMGHFKVRKTGVFWWNPHSRAGSFEAPKRRTIVTA